MDDKFESITNLEFITSSKLFTTVFDEEMKGRGFRRKGHLYYKIVGDFIQGVGLKTINPYSICFHAFPWWSEPSYFQPNPDLSKGYWTENGMEISPDALFGGYYKKENVEVNFDAMKVNLELAKEYFLPIVESVKDYDSYIKYKSLVWPEKQFVNIYLNEFYIQSWEDKYAEQINDRKMRPVVWMFYAQPNPIDQYVYLYKAFLDGSFDNAYKLLMEKMELIAATSGCKPDYIEMSSSTFIEKMNSNDLSWIEEYRLERKKILIPKIKKELSIVIEDV